MGLAVLHKDIDKKLTRFCPTIENLHLGNFT